MKKPASAVVFAYSDVGVRCLSVLLDAGVDVRLVVTHANAADEVQWFASVADLGRQHGLPVVQPADVNDPQVVARIRETAADWLFSFYFRQLLGAEILALPRRGALNMHGSLLPKYRGRAPVNWAVLHGEAETGASLHEMVSRADAGALIDQQAVPILQNDRAIDVARKVVVAAELVLWRTLPELLDGRAQRKALDLVSGSYFGGRSPEDGRIDWRGRALTIHNLIRAVAPPFPGAFFDAGGRRIQVLESFFQDQPARSSTPRLYLEQGCLYADCVGGRRLALPLVMLEGEPLTADTFTANFGSELELQLELV